jgi:hypothetical protein
MIFHIPEVADKPHAEKATATATPTRTSNDRGD